MVESGIYLLKNILLGARLVNKINKMCNVMLEYTLEVFTARREHKLVC